MNLICRLQNAAARSVRGALKGIKKMPSTIGAVALALASFLAWAPPAAAIDTTSYVPFAAKAVCANVPGSSCAGSLALPDRQTVLEYVSVGCSNLGLGARLFSLAFGVTTEGVQTVHYIQLPVAASIGAAPSVGTVTGQVVRLYADPNSEITVTANAFAAPASPISCTFFFSGQQSQPLPP
jgi:hypothetical protein